MWTWSFKYPIINFAYVEKNQDSTTRLILRLADLWDLHVRHLMSSVSHLQFKLWQFLTWWTAFEADSGWLGCEGLAALSYQELPLASVPSITTITTIPGLPLHPRCSSRDPPRDQGSRSAFSRFIGDRGGSSPAISGRLLIVDQLRRYLLVCAGAIWDC